MNVMQKQGYFPHLRPTFPKVKTADTDSADILGSVSLSVTAAGSIEVQLQQAEPCEVCGTVV